MLTKNFNLFLIFVSFLLGTLVFSQDINFTSSSLQGISIKNPTTLDFGPDGRLYVAQQNGAIYSYQIERGDSGAYTVLNQEYIDLVKKIPNHNDDGSPYIITNKKRQITGILAVGAADKPVLYVSSSDSRIGGGASKGDVNLDTNSGIVSRLTYDGGNWKKVDLIRGLPRSEENHANNGLVFDEETNELFVTVGGMTNAGSPSNNFAFITEYAYATSIVRVNLTALEAMPELGAATDDPYIYDLPTLDDPTRPNVGGITDITDINYVGDIGDPFGGNDGLNQAKLTTDGPVQVFATGFRNAYDIVLKEDGKIYTWDNGANKGWGGHPDNEGGGSVTNNWVPGEPGSTVATATDGIVNNKDGLHFIGYRTDVNRTYYGGHPNPIRANPAGAGLFTHNGTGGSAGVFRTSVTTNPETSLPIDWPPVPSSLADSREGDFQNSGVDDLSIYNINSSTNGLVEYRSNAAGGAMKGDLLAASFNGKILRVKLNEEGVINSDDDVTVFASGFGNVPLDVTAQNDGEVFPGTVWVAVYGTDHITIFEPADAVICTGTDSFELDDDGDGYSNADEIDAGSDPCNSALKPDDADGDFISDINDGDDDNDEIADTIDLFPLDPMNGITTYIPINYELLNGDPGFGFFGLGFTGIMHNEGTDYLDLYVDEFNSDIEIIAGGAVGLLTFNPAPVGSALDLTNSQLNGFQLGLNVQESTPPFTVSTEILNLAFGTAEGAVSFFIGDGSQENYLSFGATKDGLKLTMEESGSSEVTEYLVEDMSSITELSLQVSVDPKEGTIIPSARLQGGPTQFLSSPVSAPDSLLEALQKANPLAVGLLADNPHSAVFSSTWDSLKVGYNECSTNGGSWISLTSEDGAFEQRHECAYVRVGEKFYLFGGRGNRTMAIYDPITAEWTTGTKPPMVIHHFQPVEIDGEIWVVGAFFGGGFPNEVPLDRVLIYNPETHIWRDGPSIPADRLRASCGAVFKDRLLYLVSGIQDGHASGHVSWLDSYNVDTGVWTVLPDAPRARDHFQSVLIGNKIWNVAGRQSKAGSGPGSVFKFTIPEVDYYDIEAGFWTTLAEESNLPTPRAGNAAISYRGKLVVIGGESADLTAHSEVDLLDPESLEWTSLPSLNVGRHGTGAIEYNGCIYIASGSANRGGGPELATQEQYNPELNVTDSLGFAPILEVISDTHITAVDSGEESVISVVLANTGSGDVTLGSITVDNSAFELVAPLPTIIKEGEQLDVDVKFAPGEGGNDVFQTKLTVLSNAPTTPTTAIILSGERSESIEEFIVAQYDFGTSSNFDTGGFETRPDTATSVVTSGGSAVGFWGSHTGYVGKKQFEITQSALDTSSALQFNLAIGNWFPNPPTGTEKPTNYSVRNFTAQIFKGDVEIGTLTGIAPLPDEVSIYSLEVPADLLSAGTDYQLTFTVEAGGQYGLIDGFTVIKTPLETVYAINSGNGGAFTSEAGITYQVDEFFSAGSHYKVNTAINPISSTNDDHLYQSERYGTFSYELPVEDGKYFVTLKFAEIFFTLPSKRIFNCQAEGEPILTNFDIYSEYGHDAAHDVKFVVEVTDGVLNLDFIPEANHAKISAILVQK